MVEPVGDAICERCGRIQPQRVAFCPNCRDDPSTPLQMVRAATLHSGPLRQCIHQLKYGNQRELAAPLARYLVATFAHSVWHPLVQSIDGVVPVPLHPQRLAERGYNQAELLAASFCRMVNLPCQPAWIQRQRATPSQVGLTLQQRRQNVNNAFRASPAVSGRTLLLIDDVYTTGATLMACAAAAKAAGATHIYALTLAAAAGHHLEPDAAKATLSQLSS